MPRILTGGDPDDPMYTDVQGEDLVKAEILNPDPEPPLESVAKWRRYLTELERDKALIEATDASNECPHGHLPGDPNQSCGCWSKAA